jgi:hypothetical protein
MRWWKGQMPVIHNQAPARKARLSAGRHRTSMRRCKPAPLMHKKRAEGVFSGKANAEAAILQRRGNREVSKQPERHLKTKPKPVQCNSYTVQKSRHRAGLGISPTSMVPNKKDQTNL